MKTLPIAVAAALLAACSTNLDPNAVRGALPAAGAVQIGTPSATSSSANALVATGSAAATAPIGAPPAYTPSYAVMSYWTAVTVNVGVWWTLTVVDVITAFPPASCTDTSCTWGPWLDRDTQNTWKLVVTKDGSAFDWVMSGANALTQGSFIPVISGTAYPGPDRYHGKGTLSIDFDAGDRFSTGAKHDTGKLDVTYDNLAGAKVNATLVNGKNGDPTDPFPMDAAYAFDATKREMQVAVENRESFDQFSIRTRWDATGAGRSDAQYAAGSGGLTLEVSQCWDGAPWYTATFDPPAVGSESACVFTPALPADVVLP